MEEQAAEKQSISGATKDIALACDARGLVYSVHSKHHLLRCLVRHHSAPQSESERDGGTDLSLKASACSE